MSTLFSEAERQLFEAGLRSHIESRQAHCIERTAYFTAVAPSREAANQLIFLDPID